MEKNRRLKIIFNFIVMVISALGISAIGIIILLNSNALGEGTAASLITIIVAALGVSIGYRAKSDNKTEQPHKELL